MDESITLAFDLGDGRFEEQGRVLSLVYDPEGAKALLEEAGIVDVDGDGMREMPSGEPLELRMKVYLYGFKEDRFSELIKMNLERIGIRIQVQ